MYVTTFIPYADIHSWDFSNGIGTDVSIMGMRDNSKTAFENYMRGLRNPACMGYWSSIALFVHCTTNVEEVIREIWNYAGLYTLSSSVTKTRHLGATPAIRHICSNNHFTSHIVWQAAKHIRQQTERCPRSYCEWNDPPP
jgi:hypothetical protein